MLEMLNTNLFQINFRFLFCIRLKPKECNKKITNLYKILKKVNKIRI
jgi:hypothetical protein